MDNDQVAAVLAFALYGAIRPSHNVTHAEMESVYTTSENSKNKYKLHPLIHGNKKRALFSIMWQIAMVFVGIVSGLFVTNHSDNSNLHYSSVIGLLISTICLIQTWPWMYVLTRGGYGEYWGWMLLYMLVLLGVTIAVFVLFVVYEDYILLGLWCGYIVILIIGVVIQVIVHINRTQT